MAPGTQTNSTLQTAARMLTAAAVTSILFSIAAANILLVAALLTLLLSRQPLRYPPIRLPLLLFFLGTLVSLLFSGDIPLGLKQIYKFWVFIVPLLVYSTFRGAEDAKRQYLLWGAAGAIVGLLGVVQYVQKAAAAQQAGRPFYEFYIAARITGAMSHWMTFSGLQMVALLVLLAWALFAARGWHRIAGLAAGALIGCSIILSLTRNVWLACAAACAYLTLAWRPRVAWALPVVLAGSLVLAPEPVRARFTSFYQPHGELDSNRHRVVMFRTGWEMIKANPVVGVGPEQVAVQFNRYLPPGVLPLPSGWYGHLHNIYLQYAAERGIPTLLMLLWLLGTIVWDQARGLRAVPPDDSTARAVLQGSLATVLAVLIAGLFEHNLGDSEPLVLFLAVTTCGYVALREAKRPSA